MPNWRITAFDRTLARGICTSGIGALPFNASVALVDDFVLGEEVDVSLRRLPDGSAASYEVTRIVPTGWRSPFTAPSVSAPGSTNVPGLLKTGDNAYTVEGGACVCVSGASHHEGDHGAIHGLTRDKLSTLMEAGELTYADSKAKVVEAHREVLKGADDKPCDAGCLEKQIDASLAKSKTGDIQVRRKDGKTSKNYPMPGSGTAK